MADEQTNIEGEGAGSPAGASEGAPVETAEDRNAQRLSKDLQGWKVKAREAGAKVAAYEAKEHASAKAKEVATGDFAALEKRYQAQLADGAADLARVTGERDGLIRGQREASLVKRISTEAGGVNQTIVGALLPKLGLGDADPEAVTKAQMTTALKELQRLAPEMFTNHNGKKPPPGGAHDPNTADYWKARAAQTSSAAMGEGYSHATGRTPGK